MAALLSGRFKAAVHGSLRGGTIDLSEAAKSKIIALHPQNACRRRQSR